jgi:tetratricopeptide (TPR) repeat protein
MAQNPELNTKLVLAQDDMRLQNYEAATKSLHWLLTNAPEHSESVYIMAYKAYEKVAVASTDKQRKAMMLDSMMLAYELKEAQFGLSDLEKNNVAYRYYKYFRKNAAKFPEAIKAYQEVYKSPETVINNNIVSYMSLIRTYQAHSGPFDVKQLIDLHADVIKVINLKKGAGEDMAKMKKYEDAVDQIFFETVKPLLDCDELEKLASDGATNDIEYTKMIFAWSLEFKCTDRDYFVKATDVIANDPNTQNAGILMLRAQQEAAKGNYEEAVKLYEKAIPLSEDNIKKAEVYINIARIHALNKDKIKAREAAFKSAELDASEASAAYSFVANLYMGSFEECAEGYSQVEDRAVFLAAFDLFQKANDAAGMQAAREQFPTREQAFTDTFDEGDTLDVGCWINVKTKLKTRPSN